MSCSSSSSGSRSGSDTLNTDEMQRSAPIRTMMLLSASHRSYSRLLYAPFLLYSTMNKVIFSAFGALRSPLLLPGNNCINMLFAYFLARGSCVVYTQLSSCSISFVSQIWLQIPWQALLLPTRTANVFVSTARKVKHASPTLSRIELYIHPPSRALICRYSFLLNHTVCCCFGIVLMYGYVYMYIAVFRRSIFPRSHLTRLDLF